MATGRPAGGRDRVPRGAPDRAAPLLPTGGPDQVPQVLPVPAHQRQVAAVPPLPHEHHRAPVAGHVGVAGAHAPGQPPHPPARHVHHPQVGAGREEAPGVRLVEDDRPAVGGPGHGGAAVAPDQVVVPGAVRLHEADGPIAVEGAARVGDPAPVGAEPRAALADPAGREGPGGGQAPGLAQRQVHLRLRPRVLRPLLPPDVERGARHPRGREVVGVRDHPPRVHPRQLGQRPLAEAPAEVPQEGLAVDVRGVPPRPAVQPPHRPVLLEEAALHGGHAPDHPDVGVPATAERRGLRLLVGGQALHHPGRAGRVREQERGPPHQLPPRLHQRVGLFQVDDVGQLVGEDQAQPAVVVPEVVAAVGGHRPDVHQRVGQRGGEAVGVVLHVGEHHVDAADLDPVAPLVGLQGLVGQGRGLAGQRLEALVVVQRDPGGRKGPEPQLRRERGGPRGTGPDQDRREGQEQGPEGPAAHGQRRVTRTPAAGPWTRSRPRRG